MKNIYADLGFGVKGTRKWNLNHKLLKHTRGIERNALLQSVASITK